ncbi:MAG: DHH family phosphoesterase [Draconibacterium sp.]|nr:MAG: DHH family phosphoesterase [Draconibacterium sp.]PIF06025.1 MAG: DHH family phosphoesterase [Draconibacterium sp.]
MNYLTLSPQTDFVYLSIQISFILKETDKQTIRSVEKIFTENVKQQVTIIPHENPDGDAIGSALGLAEILINAGHRALVVSPTDYPDFLKWIPSQAEVLVYGTDKAGAAEYMNNSGVLICVDFNEPKRAGNQLKIKIEKFPNTKILIDHHPYPADFSHFTISEPSYSSTAELVYDLINAIGLQKFINLNAAEALYTGILTDTGSFSHNVDANTFRVVAELIGYGVQTDAIQSAVYHNFSADRMRLLGYCLSEKMKVFPDFRAAFISLSKKELEEYNFKTGDTEGFVNYPLSINNIVFSALFIEKEGWVKASFRSKGDFPVNHFSKNHFNGGGHKNAAGGETKLSLNDVQEFFTQLLPLYKHQLKETLI